MKSKHEIIQPKKKNNFKDLHPKESHVTESDAYLAINVIDPREKHFNEIDNSLRSIYDKLHAKIGDTKDLDDLKVIMDTIMKYKKHLLTDVAWLLKLVKQMSPEDKEIFKAIGKKYKIVQEMTKEKDKGILFGKK